MRKDALSLEAQRLAGLDLDNYPWFHERHRVFPAVFEGRGHRRILDVASGMGVLGGRIAAAGQDTFLVCNDISPKCLQSLRRSGFCVSCFDLDEPRVAFPFRDGSFDAIIALATIEHLIHVDHFLAEVRRLLAPEGHFYLSAPNYSGLAYLIPLLLTGRTFHDPLSRQESYEFFAHVRYFTYRSLLEYVASFGFHPDTIYIPLPEGSARYRRLRARSKGLAALLRLAAWLAYRASPRWSAEPVICFATTPPRRGLRKVLL